LSLFGPDLGPGSAAEEWGWLPESLGPSQALGAPSTVAAIVPGGYEGYLRIDHGESERSDGWELPVDIVEALVAHGEPQTTTPDQACFAVWEGYGWLTSQMLYSAPRKGIIGKLRRAKPFGDFEQRKADLSRELQRLPELRLPDRVYRVLGGPVRAVTTMQDPMSEWSRLVPDLWWPVDRAWFVGSDTDFKWTYLAGSARLVDAVAAAFPEQTRTVTPTDPIE
jgi:hypothetical protein